MLLSLLLATATLGSPGALQGPEPPPLSLTAPFGGGGSAGWLARDRPAPYDGWTMVLQVTLSLGGMLAVGAGGAVIGAGIDQAINGRGGWTGIAGAIVGGFAGGIVGLFLGVWAGGWLRGQGGHLGWTLLAHAGAVALGSLVLAAVWSRGEVYAWPLFLAVGVDVAAQVATYQASDPGPPPPATVREPTAARSRLVVPVIALRF